MGTHKITMRDIAKECGISVATVSYVLNHSEKEKISHEMRLKVLETATRLHYEPHTVNTSGRSKSGLVGIIVCLKETNTAGKKMLSYDLAAELSSQLRVIGYETILITTKNLSQDMGIIKKHSLDAVFMIDVDNRTVRKVAEGCYVPMLFLDCTVSDPLFCEIRPDYNSLFAQAKGILGTDDPFLLTEDFCCQNQMEQFLNHFRSRDIYIHTVSSDLRSFLFIHKGQKGIVLGDMLGVQAGSLFSPQDFVVLSSLGDAGLFQPGMQVLYVPNRTKAAMATRILQDMVSLDYQASSANCVLLNSERLS